MSDDKRPEGKVSEGVPGQISEGEFIHPLDGPDHGYYGTLPHTEPPEVNTVAGVTGGTANVDDPPKSATKATPKSSGTSK